MHVATTVDDQGLSGDEITFVTGQENHGPDQVFRLLQAAERRGSHVVLSNVAGERSAGLRVSEARCDRVDADVVGA